MTEWISVKDREPQNEVEVLLVMEYHNRKNRFIGYKNENGWYLKHPISKFAEFIYDDKPTHWMPLPESPK